MISHKAAIAQHSPGPRLGRSSDNVVAPSPNQISEKALSLLRFLNASNIAQAEEYRSSIMRISMNLAALDEALQCIEKFLFTFFRIVHTFLLFTFLFSVGEGTRC